MSYQFHHEVTIEPGTKLKAGITNDTFEQHEFWYHDSQVFVVKPNGELFYNEENYNSSTRVSTFKEGLEGYVSGDDYLQHEEFADFLRDNLISGSVKIVTTSEEGGKSAYWVYPGNKKTGVMSIQYFDEGAELPESEEDGSWDDEEE